MTRWARLPAAINGKSKHRSADGTPFACRLKEWRPERRYAPEEIIEGLSLELAPIGRPPSRKRGRPALSVNTDTSVENMNGEELESWVLMPRAAENPVVTALKAKGLYKRALGPSKHEITCPWVEEHTDSLDTGAAYFEPTKEYPLGGFVCLHSHRDKYRLKELLNFLAVTTAEARNATVIRVVNGALYQIVDAAEAELAACEGHYQAGNLIVSINIDPSTGDPAITHTSQSALTAKLSKIVSWERLDRRSNAWFACDPPQRHVTILHDLQSYSYLSPLIGLARQPYFRESDGALVFTPGYDPVGRRFSMFDSKQYRLAEPTKEAALNALVMLEDLLEEFAFLGPADKSAALSAIFTAVVRPSLPHAPAFHVRAPVYGSGKTYLCEVIGAFAGPGGNEKISYPMSSEEATKVILAALLPGPACIEFDDMDTDWIPHGVIKRMLTAETITDRILGVSKTATVSTRTLFLGSGNNVGPVRDLLRRVLTINIDPRCQTPATKKYRDDPLKNVRDNRPVYVSAVLSIIRAWQEAGMPKASVDSIATYNGAWSDLCRHPLLWLGHADPATALFEQVGNDPENDALANLLSEWLKQFGSSPTTIRKAVDHAESGSTDLNDAILEFPVEDHGRINRNKLGWIMKKVAARVVDGYAFEAAQANGRKAWRVIKVEEPFTKKPLSPLSPVRYLPLKETVTEEQGNLAELEL